MSTSSGVTSVVCYGPSHGSGTDREGSRCVVGTEATVQLSEVVGAVSTTVAKQEPESVFIFTAAAQVMVGFSLSVTVTF